MSPSPSPFTLIAVHAHPDDEVIGTGGILARYSEAGHHVALVCSTRGEVGEIVDPDMKEEEVRPHLAEVRDQELRCACGVLGVRDLISLGYRDSGMAGTEDNNHPGAFCQADMDEATGRLVAIARRLKPQVLVTYDEKGGYGHPDHIMAHKITVAAFDAAGDSGRYPEAGPAWQPSKLYYTVIPLSGVLQMMQYFKDHGQPTPFDREGFSPEQFGTPDELVTTRVDVRDYLSRKIDALRCHRSQIAPDSFFFNLPEEMGNEGFGYEHFTRARSLVEAPVPEEDLFAGL